MLAMLYRPNFCCNCGEKIERANWPLLASRRFCELCETEKKEHDYFTRAAMVLCIVSGLFGVSAFVLGSKENTAGGPAGNTASARSQKPPVGKDANSQAGNSNTIDENLSKSPNPGSPEAIPASRSLSNRSSDTPSADPVFYCGAITKKGTPCTRRVKTKGAFCWQHAGTSASRGNDRPAGASLRAK